MALRFLQIEITAKSKHVVEYTLTKQKSETKRQRVCVKGREQVAHTKCFFDVKKWRSTLHAHGQCPTNNA